MNNFEFADQIRRLGSRTISSEAATGGHCKWNSAHIADDRANLPAAEDVAGHSRLQQWLSRSKRELKERPDFEVVGAVKAGRPAVLVPIRRVREKQGGELFIV